MRYIPYLAALIAAAYLLPRVVQRVLEPDYVLPYDRVERDISDYLREIISR